MRAPLRSLLARDSAKDAGPSDASRTFGCRACRVLGIRVCGA